MLTIEIIDSLECIAGYVGPEFTCVDPTGEQALTGMIVSVTSVSGLLLFHITEFSTIG